MFERAAIVRNANGIHCRPSAVIVKEAQDYGGQILVTSDSQSCDLRSVVSLLTLGLQSGSRITIQVDGPEEERMGARLVELFETHFDFPPRDAGGELIP